eukprot:2459475-Amphidinium_carterae.1
MVHHENPAASLAFDYVLASLTIGRDLDLVLRKNELSSELDLVRSFAALTAHKSLNLLFCSSLFPTYARHVRQGFGRTLPLSPREGCRLISDEKSGSGCPNFHKGDGGSTQHFAIS